MMTLHRFGPIKYKKIYYASSIPPGIGYNVDLLHAKDLGNLLGYVKTPIYAKIINLKNDLEIIKADFCHSTLRDIKRAEQEKIKYFPDYKDYSFFVNYYNNFARLKKNIKYTNLKFYLRNSEIISLSACGLNDDILVMHSYLLDYKIKKVHCYKSASHYRNTDDKERRSLIARANKYLHYRDMQYFKELGFDTYDFGGYALYNNSFRKNGLNEFKNRFGGEWIIEYDYIHFYKYFIDKLRALILKIIQSAFVPSKRNLI